MASNESQSPSLSKHLSQVIVADDLAADLTAECSLPLHKTFLNRRVSTWLLHRRLYNCTMFHMWYSIVNLTYTLFFPQLICKYK